MGMSGQVQLPDTLNPSPNQGKSPRSPEIIGWVGPKAGVDVLEDRQISCPCQESNRGSSDIQSMHSSDVTI
jgi:hypothetical protein